MPSPRPLPAFRETTDRRRLAAAALIAFPALWLGAARPAHAQGGARLRLTPSQTEGPFYPPQLPADHDGDLLRTGTLRYTRGDAGWVEGTVVDASGQPVRDATVEIWQCDESGHYHHPGDGGRADPAFQGFGRTQVDADGRWRFHTIRPVPYSGRTPHIHMKVKRGERELLTTQLYVKGASGNARDFLWRNMSEQDRAALTLSFDSSPEGWKARFPVVVAT
ncbi:protocatechuate 3,4-dioxygenase [Variovorax dokdonensis]|uniref:Protocatechuate 3,4-dioxygenase n=1 Tax=Variovorax dokdonensis TaxID=344883 RepID=A0ABT7NCZ4_9BURK|nr:protocatechuate 3,4-dioxygenase [Variovorax dokdonensis]MDM0045730.1 protocatechuate 3,4-dioxygenase [Variovorax dokdonensis]